MTINSDKTMAAVTAGIRGSIVTQNSNFCIGRTSLLAGYVEQTINVSTSYRIPFAFTYEGNTYTSTNAAAWAQFLALISGISDTLLLPGNTVLTCAPDPGDVFDCSSSGAHCTLFATTGPCFTAPIQFTGGLVYEASINTCTLTPEQIAEYLTFNL